MRLFEKTALWELAMLEAIGVWFLLSGLAFAGSQFFHIHQEDWLSIMQGVVIIIFYGTSSFYLGEPVFRPLLYPYLASYIDAEPHLPFEIVLVLTIVSALLFRLLIPRLSRLKEDWAHWKGY